MWPDNIEERQERKERDGVSGVDNVGSEAGVVSTVSDSHVDSDLGV